MGDVSVKVISTADEHSCGPGGAVGSGAAVGAGEVPSTGFGGAGTCVGRGVGRGALVGWGVGGSSIWKNDYGN